VGLFQLSQSLGKFPHEFSECTQEEITYMTAAWNTMQANSQKRRR
jgi:hypothetical protein